MLDTCYSQTCIEPSINIVTCDLNSYLFEEHTTANYLIVVMPPTDFTVTKLIHGSFLHAENLSSICVQFHYSSRFLPQDRIQC